MEKEDDPWKSYLETTSKKFEEREVEPDYGKFLASQEKRGKKKGTP
jgi:hypothetical protein